jgi:hypothetical protein
LRVLTLAGQSYGEVPDTDIRGGASGGMITDTAGRLVGEVTGSEQSFLTVEAIEEQYNVDLMGETADSYGIAYIKTIDQSDINSMASSLGPECTKLSPRPAK